MQLKDIMSTNVEVIRPDATIQEAAKKMDDLDVGGLPVCDGDRIVGFITDRDIVVRSIAIGAFPNQSRVQDAMTSPVDYCYEDDDVRDAAKVMEEKQIRRLLVLNRDKRLVGILALADLATTTDERLTGEITRNVSEPEKPAA